MKKIIMQLIAFGVCMIVFCGCSDTDSNHPMLKKAGQSIRMGEYRNAEICYKKYLAKNPSAAFVHYSLANLYDEHLEEYLLAVYHYKESLRLQPDASEESVRIIESYIKRCEQKYVHKGKTVKKVFLTDEEEIERMTAAYKKNLAEQQKKAEAELARLKKEEENVKKQQLSDQKTPDSPVAVKNDDKKDIKSDAGTAEKKVSEKLTPDTPVLSEKITSDTPVAAEKIAEDSPVIAENIKADTPVAAENIKADSPVMSEKIKSDIPVVNVEKDPKESKQEVIKDFSRLPSMQQEKIAPAADDTVKEYKVKRGDTFSHLSRKFYGSVRYYKLLMQYNKISNPNALRIGKTLKVPPLHILKGEKNEK